MKLKSLFSHSFAISLLSCSLAAQAVERPSPEQAQKAMLDMLALPADLAPLAKIRLGSCVAALQPQHPRQIACTLEVKIAAGSSETQADFYPIKRAWRAQPSQSQQLLPFPDPALR